MDWRKELEARLADDPRLERKKSRFSEATAFFLEGKEIAHFQNGGEIDIRLTAAGIFAFKEGVNHESVAAVATDWLMVRLQSEEDLEFAMKVLDRAIRAAKARVEGPKGKKTRRKAAGKVEGKSEAMKALRIAKALKELEEFKPGKPS